MIMCVYYNVVAAEKDGSSFGDDPYELALTAYALNMARLPEADEVMAKLMSLAVDSPSGLYWQLPNSKGNLNIRIQFGIRCVASDNSLINYLQIHNSRFLIESIL